MSDLPLDTIIHGDCLEVMKDWPDGCVDAVVTDPPYGVAFEGKNTKHTVRRQAGYTSHNDNTPGLRNMFRYPEPDGVGAIYYPSGAGLGRWGFTCWQPIFYYGRNPYLVKGMGHRPDSFSTTQATRCHSHPCAKPIETALWLLDKACPGRGETVLDPFCGSGTTAVACVRTGRRYIGIEIDEGYCEIARRRVAAETPSLFAPTNTPIGENDKSACGLQGEIGL